MKTKEELADWLREQNSDLLLRLYKYYVSDDEHTIHKMDDLQRVCGDWPSMVFAKAICEGGFDYTDSYFFVSTDNDVLYSCANMDETIIAVIGYRDFAIEILNGFPTGSYKFPELTGFLFGDCYVPFAVIRRDNEFITAHPSAPCETLEAADRIINSLKNEFEVIASWIVKNDTEVLGITTDTDKYIRFNKWSDLR